MGCEKRLRRVSSALGIGIKRTKSQSSPLAVHSTGKSSLYVSAGKDWRLLEALRGSEYCCDGFVARAPPSAKAEELLYQAGAILRLDWGQSLAINVSCHFQNMTTCILDHEGLRERGVHASATIYGKGASAVRCIKPTKDETRCSSRFPPAV